MYISTYNNSPGIDDCFVRIFLLQTVLWARICERLWSPGIDSEESISPTYICSLTGRYEKEGCRTGPPG